jgi:hypothetical protein
MSGHPQEGLLRLGHRLWVYFVNLLLLRCARDEIEAIRRGASGTLAFQSV